jgi:hypothetical protein
VRKFLILSLLLYGSASSAQFIVVGPNVAPGTVSPSPGGFGQSSPTIPWLWADGNSITPTMQRQRDERARRVEILFPHLREEMARHSPERARYIYARAEKEAMWAMINARKQRDEQR